MPNQYKNHGCGWNSMECLKNHDYVNEVRVGKYQYHFNHLAKLAIKEIIKCYHGGVDPASADALNLPISHHGDHLHPSQFCLPLVCLPLAI